MSTPVTLRNGGVEYIHWTVTGLPVDPPATAIEASLDNGTTWHAAAVDGTDVALLVAHPAAVAPDPLAVVAAAGGSRELLLRVTDTPEVIIRSGGFLAIK